jgi:hypothetical protein
MSGSTGDRHANWITTEWPPEVRDVLRWQWDEVLIPYWRRPRGLANEQACTACASSCTAIRTSTNVATLKRLRDAVGETVGANLDPSHLMWMGADPLAPPRRWARPSTTSTRRTPGSIPSMPASMA